jgi:hypothetical protein
MRAARARRVLVVSALAAAACALAAGPVLADPPRHQAAHATPRRSAHASAAAAAPAPAPVPAPDPFPFSSAPPPPDANGPITIVGPDGRRRTCLEQRAQDFLIRSNWFNHGPEGSRMFQQSLRYRTEHYGYFPGFGRPEWNHTSPRDNAVSARFMGMPIQINARVVPALQCVEASLRAGPAHLDYHPHGIGGIRFQNTYRGGEVSNHVYGIAMDIDSETNTCCGCLGNWPHAAPCGRRVSSIYDRMSMPNSWVETFERYGWYWLGHDVLQDTMHFEFLGDPDKILAP